MKELSTKERVKKLEKTVNGFVVHELKWHRWLLLILLGLAVAKLFT